MKTQEFKIGAVYSPDGGRTTMLIAAPTAFELRRAWACFAQVKLDPDMAFRIKAIEDGEELTDAEKMRLKTAESTKKLRLGMKRGRPKNKKQSCAPASVG